MGFTLRVKDLDLITARSSCGRAKSGSGLDVTQLAPNLREQLSRCTGMVAEGPGRAAAALRFPTPLSGSIRAPGIHGRGSGFLRSTRIRPIHGAVVRRHHMYDQTFQQPRLQTCREQSRHTDPPHRTPSALCIRDGLAPQRLRQREPCGSAQPFRRLRR